MAEPIALVALALDAALGWPAGLYARIGHPVGAFGWIIARGERRWNDAAATALRRRLMGIVLLVVLIGVAVVAASIAEQCSRALLGAHAWLLIGVLAAPGIAQRSLFDHLLPVARCLARRDVDGARSAVARIVGRDTAALDDAGIARAGIESLAESFCDGIVAPVCWLLVAGLPGLWAYKAINTADSMIGHKEARWRAFGWAAARIDDGANLVPARLAGVLICLSGMRGWRTMIRDAGNHASPNAGWPEAAMAGVLGIALAGPVAYDGVMHDKPWIGTGRHAATARDMRRALRVYLVACALLWLIAGSVAWLR